MSSVSIVDAKTAAISLDQFRGMVNYVNTKNKGYVRFAMGANGNVQIAKVNNKIDIPLCFRFGMSKAHNQELRRQFVSALTGGLLQYADQMQVDELKRSIVGGDAKKPTTDALSRRQVDTAFQKYDELVNTFDGRRKILDNVLTKLFGGKDSPLYAFGGKDGGDLVDRARHLLQEYGKGEATKNLMENYLDFIRSADGDEKENGHRRMEKSETEFAQFLTQVENAFQEVTDRARIDLSVTRKTQNMIMNPTGDIRLEEQDAMEWHGTLLRIMQSENIKDVSLGGLVGTSGYGLDLFVTKVLPEAIRACHEEVSSLGGSLSKEEVEDLVKDRLGIDAVVDLLKEFLAGLRDAVNEDDYFEREIKDWSSGKYDLPGQSEAVNMQQRASIVDAMKGLKAQSDTAQLIQARGFMLDLCKTTNCAFVASKSSDKLSAARIMHDYNDATKISETECRAEFFAHRFILTTFRHATEIPQEKGYDLAGIQAKNAELREKITNAVKLEVGAKGEDHGLTEFTDAALKYIADTCAKRGFGTAIADRLVSFLMPTLVSRKVAHVFASTGASFELGQKGFDTLLTKIDFILNAVEAKTPDYTNRVATARKAFVHQLEYAQRTRVLDDDTVRQLKNRFDTVQREAYLRAIEDFFTGATADWSDAQLDLQADEAETRFAQLLRRAESDLMTEMEGRLVDITHARMVQGGKAPTYEDTVDATLTEVLKKDSLHTIGSGTGSFLTEDEAKIALANGGLRTVWNKVMSANPPEKEGVLSSFWNHTILGKDWKRPTVTEAWANDVKTQFATATAQVIRDYRAFEQAFLREALRVVAEGVEGQLVANVHTQWVATLPEAEKTALFESLARDILAGQSRTIGNILRDFLVSPARYAKAAANPEEMNQLVLKELLRETVLRESLPGGLMRTYRNRGTAVVDWTASKEVRSNIEGEIYRQLRATAGKDLSDAELLTLTEAAAKDVLAKAGEQALLYADGGVVKFTARVANEVVAATKGAVAGYAKLRAAFLASPEAKKAETDYMALGTENIASVKSFCLNEFARRFTASPAGLTAKDMHDFHASSLRDRTLNIFDRKYEDFLKLRDTIDAATTAMIDAVHAEVEQGIAALREKGASDETIEACRAAAREFIEDCSTLIVREASATGTVDDVDGTKAGNVMTEVMARIADELGKVDVREANLANLVKGGTFGEYVENDASYPEKNQALPVFVANLRSFLATDEAKAVVRKAQLNAVARGFFFGRHPLKGDEQSLPQELKQGLVDFQAYVEQPLRDVVSAEATTSYVDAHFAIAHASYMHLLDRLDLSSRKTAVNKTDRERLEIRFAERLAEMGRKAAADPKSVENENVLSAKFMSESLDYFNGQALDNKFNDWLEVVLPRALQTAETKYPQLFGIHVNDANRGVRESEQVALNHAALRNRVLAESAETLRAWLKKDYGIDAWNRQDLREACEQRFLGDFQRVLGESVKLAESKIAQARKEDQFEAAYEADGLEKSCNAIVEAVLRECKVDVTDGTFLHATIEEVANSLRLLDDPKLTARFAALWNPDPKATDNLGSVRTTLENLVKNEVPQWREKVGTSMDLTGADFLNRKTNELARNLLDNFGRAKGLFGRDAPEVKAMKSFMTDFAKAWKAKFG